jgi:hypothetical protein
MNIIEKNREKLRALLMKGFPDLQKGALEGIYPGDFYIFKGNLYLIAPELRDGSITIIVRYRCKKSVAAEILALLNECSSDPIIFERERQMTQGECEMLYDAIRFHYNPEYDKIMVDAGKRFFF